MTARQLYEGVLIELNKENAPNLILEDFNYFANKAINNYVNKRYNIYDINQQTTDDLRVLKSSASLIPKKVNDLIYHGMSMAGDHHMANYEVILPPDYLHILNCICVYKVNQTFRCYNKDDYWRAAATRLTADQYSQVLDNFWNKPTYKRPYYYIHNVNFSQDTILNGNITHVKNPTDPYNAITNPTGMDISGTIDHHAVFEDSELASSLPNNPDYGTDAKDKSIVQGVNGIESMKIKIGNNSEIDASLRERGAGIRYGNKSQVRMEIRYGTDDSVFTLERVNIDYIKAPQFIRLTQEEIDRTIDYSQMLEYPDYVCQEIINELVHLIMENLSDQRLQTHPVVSQSIANPTQQQTPEAAGQTA